MQSQPKAFTLLALVASLAGGGAAFGAAPAALTVAFADAKWTGDKVPADQVCQKFKGHGATPALKVSGLPQGTTAIVLSFNDETYQPMNNGGHGAVRFAVAAGSKMANLPSVPGETDAFPKGVTTEKAHLNPEYSGTKGAYLPPCSGGSGNTYSATVKAMSATNTTLAQGRIVLGKY